MKPIKFYAAVSIQEKNIANYRTLRPRIVVKTHLVYMLWDFLYLEVK